MKSLVVGRAIGGPLFALLVTGGCEGGGRSCPPPPEAAPAAVAHASAAPSPSRTSIPGARPLSTRADTEDTVGEAPFTVKLAVEVEEGSGTPPFTRVWDFGDATPFSTEQAPSHVYTVPGTFRASVITTGADGETDQDWVDILVLPNLDDPGIPPEERERRLKAVRDVLGAMGGAGGARPAPTPAAGGGGG